MNTEWVLLAFVISFILGFAFREWWTSFKDK